MKIFVETLKSALLNLFFSSEMQIKEEFSRKNYTLITAKSQKVLSFSTKFCHNFNFGTLSQFFITNQRAMKSTFLMEFCELKQLTAAQRPHIYSKEEENGAKILIN